MIIPQVKNNKMSAVLEALVKNRKKVLSKGLGGVTTFFLGKDKIVLEEEQVAMGDEVIKLKKVNETRKKDPRMDYFKGETG